MTQDLVPPERFATFGQLLRHLRKRARLTLRELSIATGYSEGHLANLERDARRPDVATVQARLLPALDAADAPAWAARLVELAAAASQPARDRADDAHASSLSQPAFHAAAGAIANLLATKLFAPQPRANSVPRTQLLQQLNRALTVPLTLVAAPAGAGKTTLLAEWITHLRLEAGGWEPGTSPLAAHRQPPAPQVAWLSLDAEDNDLATFVRYLVAACQQLAPHAGAAVLALLPQAPQLSHAALLHPLLNDLAALDSPGVVILDDCHVLTAPAVQAVLAFFLEHLPPQLHLVIASREDPPLPLARMRARGTLVELRARDLRFTSAESTAFLRTTMELDITPADAAILEARTEGWAAGLQLAALALRDRSDRADVIADLSGTSRYLVDYLGDEVVDRLPPHLRTFVLQTCILDRMCGALCDAILGVDGWESGDDENAAPPNPQSPTSTPQAYSQHTLNELERRHLFIVPLDQQRHWYRYHQLFADVLRSKVRAAATASQIATLYRRASRWHEQQGLSGEAIRYALEARLPEEAAQIVEQHAATMIEQSAYGELRHWLDLLPEAIILARPRLCLAQSIVLMVAEPSRVEPFLAHMEQLAHSPAQAASSPTPPDAASWLDNVPAAVLVIRGILARGNRDYSRAIALQERAIAEVGPSFTYLRGRALLQLGIAQLLRGALSTAEVSFRSLLEAAERTAASRVLVIESVAWLGEVLTIRGRLHEAAALYERTIAQNDQPHLPILSSIYISLSDLHYEWNDLARAEQDLQRGFEFGERLASIPLLLRSYTSRARLLLARGDREAARASARKAQELLDILGPLTTSPRPPPLSKIMLALGDAGAAEAWAQRRGLRYEHGVAADTEPELLAFARVLLARRDWSAVRDLTDRLLARAEAEERTDSSIDILIIQALADSAQGQRAVAAAALGRALQLAAPGGYLRRFVDEGAPVGTLLHDLAAQGLLPSYVERLIAAFPGTMIAAAPPKPLPASGAQPLAEPLSERELEVLRMIAAGHANQAIAQALTIEVGTVKRHIHSLLGKLAVHSRTAAVARARALGLL